MFKRAVQELAMERRDKIIVTRYAPARFKFGKEQRIPVKIKAAEAS